MPVPDFLEFRAKQGQDKWVLSQLNGKRGGYFVEVGAYNGVTDSNTYGLERRYGWSGICIEPNPAMATMLRRRRTCVCETVCIYDSHGAVAFVPMPWPQLAGIYNDSCSKRLRQAVENDVISPIRLEAITLTQVLDRNNSPAVVDYLSVDTEGSEFQVLNGLDFSRYRISLITVEHNCVPGMRDDRTLRNRQSILELLTRHGYRLDRSVAADDWYRHESLQE